MDIEKLKAEFEQSECFKRLEHVAQYTFFEFGAYIKRTDVPADIEKKYGKLITALLFSWSAWKEAKSQAVPEGFVLVPKEPTDKTIAHMINTPIEVNLLCDHADVFLSEGEAYIAYQAMIAAQEPAND